MTELDITRPTSVAFAEFTKLLLSQTLDAVIDAQLDQEEKLRNLEIASQLDLEEFAQEFVSMAQVDVALASIFPPQASEDTLLLDYPYQPEDGKIAEDPPIYLKIGYRMQRYDTYTRKGQTKVSRRGVENIRIHLRRQLAEEKRKNLHQMLQRGLPRVFVDQGRVNAKLLFEVESISQQEDALAESTPVFSTITSRESPTYLTAPKYLSPYQLKVKTIDLRRPEETRLEVNMVGEVEITFKTITE